MNNLVVSGHSVNIAGVNIMIYRDSDGLGCGVNVNGILYFKSIKHDWEYFDGNKTVTCDSEMKSILNSWAETWK